MLFSNWTLYSEIEKSMGHVGGDSPCIKVLPRLAPPLYSSIQGPLLSIYYVQAFL